MSDIKITESITIESCLNTYHYSIFMRDSCIFVCWLWSGICHVYNKYKCSGYMFYMYSVICMRLELPSDQGLYEVYQYYFPNTKKQEVFLLQVLKYISCIIYLESEQYSVWDWVSWILRIFVLIRVRGEFAFVWWTSGVSYLLRVHF